MSSSLKRAVVLIDGVHKADNSINGIRELSSRLGFTPVRLVWIGGTEKMKDAGSFSREFAAEFGLEVIFVGDLESGKADAIAFPSGVFFSAKIKSRTFYGKIG